MSLMFDAWRLKRASAVAESIKLWSDDITFLNWTHICMEYERIATASIFRVYIDGHLGNLRIYI